VTKVNGYKIIKGFFETKQHLMQIEFLQASLVSMASSQPPYMQVPILPPLHPSYCVLQ
jgi:hypothetical protein